MTFNIARELYELQRIHKVVILFAVESGSRAWGFPSPDSDFDVRFVYSRGSQARLALNLDMPDTLQHKYGLFDADGWELGKALTLMIKGNSQIREWLRSPIIYHMTPIMPMLSGLAEILPNEHHALRNYWSLGNKVLHEHLASDVVNVKKYFYALRCALSLQWLREYCFKKNLGSDKLPMNFQELIDSLQIEPLVLKDIKTLLELKLTSREMGNAPSYPRLQSYMMREFEASHVLMKQFGKAHETSPITPAAKREAEETMQHGLKMADFFLPYYN